MSNTRTESESAAEDRAPAGRLRSTAEAIGAFLRRVPFAIGLAVALVITALVTGTFFGPATADTLAYWAAGVITTFDLGHWWSVFTALFVPADPFQLVAGVILSVMLLGVAERLMGTARAIIAFVVTGAIGLAVGVLIQWLGSSVGEWWATATSADSTLDPLTGIVGALIAATAFMGALWRRRVRVVTLAFILIFVLYDGDSSNSYRLIAAIAGYLLGALLARNAALLKPSRASHRERRTLIATIIAVTAIGPVVALINGSGLTPLASASYLYKDELPDLSALIDKCNDSGTAITETCRQQLVLVNNNGFGMLVLSLLPVALLLLAGWGLNNGRRFAMWLAIGVNLAILLFAQASFEVSQAIADLTSNDPSVLDLGEFLVWIIAGGLLPLGLIILLLLNRREFAIRSPRRALGRFWLTVGIAFVALAAVYFVVALLNITSYYPVATVWDIVIDTGKRFVPAHFVSASGTVIITDNGFAFMVHQIVGILFWIVFIVAAVILMQKSRSRATPEDASRIRELIRRDGGGTLGFMATWPGNLYWFAPDERGAVAYRVINDIAITLSDPICSDADAEDVIRGFVAFCDANSWTPVFYSVHPQYLPVFEAMGWLHMSVGEETLVHTKGLELAGKPWQKVRQALNRGIKEGMTTVWTTWDELPLSTVAQINAISEEWVAEKELPEMGFTLGGMEELKDPEVKLMLAVDPDGRMQAVTSWLPVYRDGVPIGWTIDFMRRTDESMNGIMEFLIASAALHMKETGAEVLSLSGAPLATKPLAAGQSAPPPTVMTRLSEFLANTLEPAYGFSSLFRFKAKFNPDYETISMAYPDPIELPTIGMAIGKAYLPQVSPKEAVALVRTLTK